LGYQDLLQVRLPVIVHLADHFALLKAVDGDQVSIADDLGERRMPLWRFQHQWDGYAIEVSTAPQVAAARSAPPGAGPLASGREGGLR